MLRRQFMQAVIAAAAAVMIPGTARAADPTPAAPPRANVIVILADDLGYADLGVQGGTTIPTPNIDSIAKGGVRFTNGYVTGPVCSPTRAGLITGRYQQRTGHEFQPRRADGLLPGERTIAEDLRDAGYATGLVGKWNLGVLPQYNPTRRGFDEFFGFTAAVHDYLPDPPEGARREGRPDDPSAGPGKLLRGTTVVDEPAYTTDAFAREAVSFIDRHHDRPYFLYLPFNAAHAPLQATEKYLSRFPNLPDRQRTYAAMVSAMDDAVGDVLRKVRETGDEHNTLVFFLSDNGGAHGNTSDNGALGGTKSSLQEGGVRVPFFCKWPARIKAGQTSDAPVVSIDIAATALAAAGAPAGPQRKLDGVDVIASLANPDAAAERALFWRLGTLWAVRQGKWKLTGGGDDPAARTKLFDLAADLGEQADIATANPQVVARLTAAWRDWDAGNIPPRWADGSKRAQRRRAAASAPAALATTAPSEGGER